MVQTILGVSWIYLMYRVGLIHAQMRDVVKDVTSEGAADLLQTQTEQQQTGEEPG